tara:strand:+ start:5796 stop:9077 length:3282 start_codon:yes stop_codon:yes gene_type:complete
MGNIIGEEIPDYTSGQINKRQSLHGTESRTTDQLVVLNSNTSWVKLASGVSIDEEKLTSIGLNKNLKGMNLARKNILFGGTSSKPKGTKSKGGLLSPKSYSNSPISGYEANPEYGIIPMPGIESISIKNLNRGSIKKASIKIKVYSRDQFDIIDTLYLRLGYTALIEWGNASYIANDGTFKTVKNTLIEDPTRFFNLAFESDRSWRDIQPTIEGYRTRYDGNYDGFLGKISNFSWDFNPDGSYDVSLEMISMGDVVESLKSNVSISPILGKFIKDQSSAIQGSDEEDTTQDYLSPYDNNNIITSMLWAWKFINRNNTGSTSRGITIKTGDNRKGFIGRILNAGASGKNIQTVTYTVMASTSFGEPDRVKATKTLKYRSERHRKQVEKDFLYEHAGGNASNGYSIKSTKSKSIEVDQILSKTSLIPTIPVIRLNTENKDHYIRVKYLIQYIKDSIIPNIKSGENFPPLFQMDEDVDNTLMYSLPNHISLDPRVCLVRNDSFFKAGTPNNPALILPELPPFQAPSPHKNSAYLMNMYLNFDFVVSSLDENTDDRGDIGLFGFLSSLCTGINKAMGGVNNLEPIVDEDSNTLKIVDSTPIPGRTRSGGRYSLEVVGYNPKYNTSTFLRNINLKTAITPEYATMMTIGATAGGYVKGVEATAFSNWNKGLTDRFKTEVTTAKNKQEHETLINGNSEAEENYVRSFLGAYTACYGFKGRGQNPSTDWTQSGVRALIRFDDDVIGNNISIVTEYYKYLQNKNKNGGSIGFIPFKFSFDMDGLSGFKIYNKLHIQTKFLPRNYGNTLDFVITGLSNSIKKNDWTTSVETMVVPKSTEIKDLEISEDLLIRIIENSNNATAPSLPPPTSIGEGDKVRVDADLSTPWKHSSVDGKAKGAYRYLQIITKDPTTGSGKYYKIPGTTCRITSGFGRRNVESSIHQAVDLAAGGTLPQTCPFKKGKIVQQVPNIYGIIKIAELDPSTDKPTGRQVRFLHSNYFGFKNGDIVNFNDIVGKEGKSGDNNPNEYDIHSHFELTLKKQGTSTKVTADNKRTVKYPGGKLPDYFVAPTIEELKCAHGLSSTPLPLPVVSNNGGVTNYKCIS